MTAPFLRGRTALVTGGASGMGRAIALALADAGASIVIGSLLGRPGDRTDRSIAYLPSRGELDGARAAIEARGATALAAELDVRDPESVRRLHALAIERFGSVDILVNAAGITVEHSVCDHPDALWDKVIDVNLSGAYRLMKQCLPAMIERKWGRIVSIASTSASVGSPTSGAYSASKAGLVGLSRCVALEGAPHGVSCNTISPTWVDTSFGRLWMTQLAADRDAGAYREKARRSNPQQRIIDPAEIAALAVFLCRDEAFGVTMQDLTVSAGSLW